MCGWVEMKNERYYIVVAKGIFFGGHVMAQMLAQVVDHSPVPRRLQQIIVRRLVPSRMQMGN